MMINQVIQEALALLLGIGLNATCQIVVVEKPTYERDNRASIVNGYIRPADANIYIVSSTPTFKAAMKGDAKAIKAVAGFIAHEDFHLHKGSFEIPAYNEQLRVLKALDADKKTIQDVELAKSMFKQ